jgi:uncharacterized integral membrane protein
MGQTAFIFFLVLAIAVALFAVQNSGSVVLRFGPMWTETSLVVVILVSVVVGAVLASLLGLPRWMRDRLQLRALRREMDTLRLSHREETPAPPLPASAASPPSPPPSPDDSRRTRESSGLT